MKKVILLIGIIIVLLPNIVNGKIGRANSPELFNFSLALNYVNIYYSYDTNYLIYEENSTYPVIGELPEHTTIYNISGNTFWLYYVRFMSDKNDNDDIRFYSSFKHNKYRFYDNQETMNIFFLKNRIEGGSCYGYDCQYNFGRVTYHEKMIAGTHYY